MKKILIGRAPSLPDSIYSVYEFSDTFPTAKLSTPLDAFEWQLYGVLGSLCRHNNGVPRSKSSIARLLGYSGTTMAQKGAVYHKIMDGLNKLLGASVAFKNGDNLKLVSGEFVLTIGTVGTTTKGLILNACPLFDLLIAKEKFLHYPSITLNTKGTTDQGFRFAQPLKWALLEKVYRSQSSKCVFPLMPFVAEHAGIGEHKNANLASVAVGDYADRALAILGTWVELGLIRNYFVTQDKNKGTLLTIQKEP